MNNKKCTSCMNCDFVWGFMCTCHYSYNMMDENGVNWHVQHGADHNIKYANRCEHYTETQYNRDEMFVL